VFEEPACVASISEYKFCKIINITARRRVKRNRQSNQPVELQFEARTRALTPITRTAVLAAPVETFKTRSYITPGYYFYFQAEKKNYLCHPLQPVAAQTLQGRKQAFGLSNKSNWLFTVRFDIVFDVTIYLQKSGEIRR